MSGTHTAQPNIKVVPNFIIDDLMARFRGFPVPGKLFDPSAAPADQLQTYGLPPKPDQNRQPLPFRIWNKGFGGPMQLQHFQLKRELVRDAHFRPVIRPLDIVPVTATRIETSPNWSGAYITANQDRRFLQVWGAWKIPGALDLPPLSQQGPATNPYVCSNWIGLDGQRLYLNSSLPQIGTASTRQPDGTTTVQAWTQWWARGNTNNAPVFPEFEVNPGDEVLCVITAQDPQTVIFVMVNLSGPVPTGMAIQGISPDVALPDGTSVHTDIAGATAEWVVERPAVVGQPNTQCNFPDYGQTTFELCCAVEGKNMDIASLFDGLPQHLRGVRLLRMFDVLPDPARTVFISMPAKLDETSLRVRYGGF